MKEALLYEKLENKSAHCFLCAHQCRIAENKFGFCGVRQNIGGVLYSLVYGRPIATHVDPIEKKPLYHFLPGSSSFSLATVGCNFHCGFCQNWEISQTSPAQGAAVEKIEEISAEKIIFSALKNKCQSIAYTYTEPTVFFEYALDIAKLAKTKGLANVFVTNGYMTKEALLMIKPYLGAANVDLKFFSDTSYKKTCAGTLAPVLETIKLMHELGIWVEVTTLVVPGQNDSPEELKGIAGFLAGVDKSIPWHISRFHPDYNFMDHPSTSIETLDRAWEIGKAAGLKFIYLGNISGEGNDTFCPACGKPLIKREVFEVLQCNIQNSKCVFCQNKVAGIFGK